ncbi:MAG TPA: fumarylacetoacetate hydrolase family protein [Marmoricola sp.]|nr:fumarylacetoacetate hydrolase family protein [Marmoricola sp.]
MSLTVLRTADHWWVQTADGAARIDTAAVTTRQLLEDLESVEAAVRSGAPVDPGDLDLLAPVTTPCRVVAQMTNFVSHVRDAGLDPATVPLTFFRKASGSISGPYDDVVRPAHVQCLDYEVEIGLVLGRELPVGTEVTADNWSSFVAGLVVTNDVSARDVQLPKTQFYESKSYPSFTPTGPALVLLTDEELERFGELRLRLWVNGELRQDAVVDGDLVYAPWEALRALSRFQRLDPGDLLLTGTPVGTALSAPPRPVELLASLLPTALKWKLFFQRQARNPKYLKAGDVVEAHVGTADGAVDLGRQRTVVRVGRRP